MRLFFYIGIFLIILAVYFSEMGQITKQQELSLLGVGIVTVVLVFGSVRRNAEVVKETLELFTEP